MMRIGQGCDFHRFDNGDRPLILGGVRIPDAKGLKGHSDADVLVHAITDAVLGSLAAGDIGHWFPPNDPKYKDANSAELLKIVLESPVAASWRLGNLDATVVCETPRLQAYINCMRDCVANLFEVNSSCISVKATTSEGMGFTGRGEGIAAFATLLLRH